MAALIRHGLLAIPLKSTSAILAVNTASLRYDITRSKSKKTGKKPCRRFEDDNQSLASKGLHFEPECFYFAGLCKYVRLKEGSCPTVFTNFQLNEVFLRYRQAYNPPEDVSSQINQICEDQAISTGTDTKLEDPLQRFNLFLACERQLQHTVPNSVLCNIETIGDLKEFYQTPINEKTPLEGMRNTELPKNLHINYDYTRFHPDTDTMFGGKTAFPKSSTLVTGLKYKKKYPGHKQEDPYLEQLLKI